MVFKFRKKNLFIIKNNYILYKIMNNNFFLNSFLESKGFSSFEGNISHCLEKINDLVKLTNTPNINVMEIGFNAGHSADIILNNNKDLTLTSFDIGDHSYIGAAKEFIDSTYPNRHTLIIGNSTKTIPNYFKNNKDTKFDFIFIDGGHSYEIAKTDLENCFHLAHKDTIVCIDDTMFTKEWIKDYSIGPTQAWIKQLQENKIIEINKKDYCEGYGMSWGKYVIN